MSRNTHSLAKEINLRQLFTIGFGTIIGTGWIIVAGSWIMTAGPGSAIAAFALGALLILFLGLGYGELGSAFPQSGGEVVYLFESMGSTGSFIVGWILALIYIATSAFEAVAAAWLISVLLPSLTGPTLYTVLGAEITLSAFFISIGGLALITWINLRGGSSAARFQEVATWLFLLASLFFVAAGITGGEFSNTRPWVAKDLDGSWFKPFVAILATVPLWYSGFNTLPQALGELRNTDTKYIRYFFGIMVLTIISGFLFYAGVILATATALPREAMSSSDLVVADALFSAFDSKWPGRIVLIAGLLGILTTWNAVFFAGARILFALGRAKIIPAFFGKVHDKYGSPSNSAAFVGLMALPAALMGRASLDPIISIVGFLFSIVYLLVSITVFCLRLRQPDIPRPFRIPGHPWTTLLSILIAAVFVSLSGYGLWVSSDSLGAEAWVLIIWTLMGTIAWVASRKERKSISSKERSQLIHMN